MLCNELRALFSDHITNGAQNTQTNSHPLPNLWYKAKKEFSTLPWSNKHKIIPDRKKAGYEGTLGENDRVCFSCYKSHLHILKHTQNVSTDSDLKEFIMETKCNLIKIQNAEDAMSTDVSMTTVHVRRPLSSKTLLRQCRQKNRASVQDGFYHIT
jgi:hypothetical protein